MRNEIIGFHREYEDNGCFCNWYPAEFDYAGRHYLHSEQFMMYQKVMMFGPRWAMRSCAPPILNSARSWEENSSTDLMPPYGKGLVLLSLSAVSARSFPRIRP